MIACGCCHTCPMCGADGTGCVPTCVPACPAAEHYLDQPMAPKLRELVSGLVVGVQGSPRHSCGPLWRLFRHPTALC